VRRMLVFRRSIGEGGSANTAGLGKRVFRILRLAQNPFA
jgi:hypothetical protein